MPSWRRPAFLHSHPFVAGVPLAFLCATVILVAVLAWQAYSAAASHRALAERVLHDYADLAATELVRRSTSFIGNYGFGAAIRGLRRATISAGGTLPSRDALAAAIPRQSRRAIELAGTLVRFDTQGRQFEMATGATGATGAMGMTGATGAGGQIADDIRRALIERARAPLDRPVEYRVLHLTSNGGSTRSFVFTSEDVDVDVDTGVGERAGGGRRAARLGFEVNQQALAQWFSEFVLTEPLLPQALASRDAAQSSMLILVRSPDGRVLVRSSSDTPQPQLQRQDTFAISIRRALEDRNENSLAPFSVEVAIDPSAAHRLVIGGLPESRVGPLLALLLLALGLAGAAVVQIGRARALAQLREDFVTRVSHELRTPVARIRMFAETLLLDRVRTGEERRQSLEAIDRGSRRLAHLIENVMQFSRQRSPLAAAPTQLLTEPTDVTALAREVIAEFDAMNGAPSRIRLRGPRASESSAMPDANVDREAFRQILLNLLDNSTKYAGTSAVDVDVDIDVEFSPVSAAADGHEQVQLRIADHGPGIPAPDRAHVWQPYFRLDRDRRSPVAGAGIGLAVVRDLVTLHGGRCWIEDTPGGGATFVVIFTAAQRRPKPGGEGE